MWKRLAEGSLSERCDVRNTCAAIAGPGDGGRVSLAEQTEGGKVRVERTVLELETGLEHGY